MRTSRTCAGRPSGSGYAGNEPRLGGSDADRLGTRPLDPRAEPGEQCHGDFYTGAIDEGSSDPMHRMSRGLDETPPEHEDAMAPAADDRDCRSAGAPVLAVLLLALVPRRRRTRPLAPSAATHSWSSAAPA